MNDNSLVVKANAIIEAGYKLGEVEQRLLILAIIQVHKNHMTVEQLRGKDIIVHASEYAKLFGVSIQTSYKALRVAVLSLYRAEWGYKYIDENGEERERYERFTVAADRKKGAIVEKGAVKFRFSDAILPFVAELKERFTSYEAKQISNLSSSYAMRLYEFFIQFMDKKSGKGWFKISLDDLRFRLGLTENDYNRLDNFKRKVLDLALREINDNTDIDATYTQQKNGRKITGFTFEFKYKKGRKPKHETTKTLLNAPNATTSNNKSSLTKKPTLESLTELERKVVAEANAYADKINASPSHRQNLVKKALDDNKKLEQENIKTQEAEKAKQMAKKAKQQADKQTFDDFWVVASDDEKQKLYAKAIKSMSVCYHKHTLQQALNTDDFSEITDEFINDPYVKERLIAVFKRKDKPKDHTEAPKKPTEPQNTPQVGINMIWASYTKYEQEAIKDYTTWYLNINNITDPKKVREVKKMAIENRWGIADNNVKLVDDSVDPKEFAF